MFIAIFIYFFLIKFAYIFICSKCVPFCAGNVRFWIWVRYMYGCEFLPVSVYWEVLSLKGLLKSSFLGGLIEEFLPWRVYWEVPSLRVYWEVPSLEGLLRSSYLRWFIEEFLSRGVYWTLQGWNPIYFTWASKKRLMHLSRTWKRNSS